MDSLINAFPKLLPTRGDVKSAVVIALNGGNSEVIRSVPFLQKFKREAETTTYALMDVPELLPYRQLAEARDKLTTG